MVQVYFIKRGWVGTGPLPFVYQHEIATLLVDVISHGMLMIMNFAFTMT